MCVCGCRVDVCGCMWVYIDGWMCGCGCRVYVCLRVRMRVYVGVCVYLGVGSSYLPMWMVYVGAECMWAYMGEGSIICESGRMDLCWQLPIWVDKYVYVCVGRWID